MARPPSPSPIWAGGPSLKGVDFKPRLFAEKRENVEKVRRNGEPRLNGPSRRDAPLEAKATAEARALSNFALAAARLGGSTRSDYVLAVGKIDQAYTERDIENHQTISDPYH